MTDRPVSRPIACIDPEDLAAILARANDDPERHHVETCPRCSALAASFQTFVEVGDVPAEANVAAAEAQLRHALEREMGGSGSPEPRHPGGEVYPGKTESFWTRFFGTGLRPAWSFAVVLLVVGAVVVMRQVGPSDDPGILLRGEDPSAGDLSLILLPPTQMPDGSMELRWQPVIGADHYEVRLYTPALDQIARHPASSATVYVLDTDELRALNLETVLWRVIARRGGGEIARSTVRTFSLR